MKKALKQYDKALAKATKKKEKFVMAWWELPSLDRASTGKSTVKALKLTEKVQRTVDELAQALSELNSSTRDVEATFTCSLEVSEDKPKKEKKSKKKK